MNTLVVVIEESTESIIAKKSNLFDIDKSEKLVEFNKNKARLLPYIAEVTKRVVDVNNAFEFIDHRGVNVGGDPTARFLTKHSREVLDFNQYLNEVVLTKGEFSTNGSSFTTPFGVKLWLNTHGNDYTGLEYSLQTPIERTPKSITHYIELVIDDLLPKKI